MAAGTVGYTDTRGNKDYTSMIASQIGNRLKQASNMASEERAYASKQAEAGGTSLEEAGIGKGYFFGRALGSRFGGDRIARAKGRMGMGGAGTNPATNYKERFRGGFDYNVTNQSITDVAPLSNALVVGLRGVEQGLSDVAGAIQRQGTVLNQLSQSQADMAKATMFNGYLFAMFQSQQRRSQGRASLRREERSIERGASSRRIGGASFGGAGGGRGMINVTGGKSGGGAAGLFGGLTGLNVASFGVDQSLRSAAKKGTTTGKAIRAGQTGLRAGLSNPMKGAKTLGASIGKNLNKVTQNVAKMFKIRPNAVKSALKTVNKGKAATAATTDALGVAKNVQTMDPFMDLIGDKEFTKGIGDGADGIKLRKEINEIAMQSKSQRELDQIRQFAEFGVDDPGVIMEVRATPVGDSAALAKNVTPEQAANLAPYRMASAQDAGVKAVDIAGDQLVKKGVKQGLRRGGALTRMLVKKFGAAGVRSGLKKIPIIAGLAGVAFGIQRALEGDFLGAGLEVTSGLLGATGVGGGLGLGIDGFLLARDLGMTPMAEGGIVKGRRGLGLPMMLGNRLPSVVGEGGSDEAVLPLNKKTFLNFGLGMMDAMKDKKSDYAKFVGMGVFSGIGDAASGGLFENIGGGISNIIDGVKDMFGNFKDNFKETFTNLKETLGNTFNNLKEKFGEKFSNFKDSLVNKYNNFKDSVGNKINNVKQWWNKDTSDGSMVDNARVGIKNWWNRAFGKKDANVENGNVNVVPGTLPSNYKEEEAKYFQTGMYTPNVENSGINVIPGNMTGPTVITNNYYGGGGNGGGVETGEGNPTMNDLGFEGLVTNYALATK
mgnify:CR=1 FL=1|tara:strand:- start:5845 stop:8334 length:2490 start_codon:yes stop_codon:yes gene_type:complete